MLFADYRCVFDDGGVETIKGRRADLPRIEVERNGKKRVRVSGAWLIACLSTGSDSGSDATQRMAYCVQCNARYRVCA
jgi:hypothetical protein